MSDPKKISEMTGSEVWNEMIQLIELKQSLWRSVQKGTKKDSSSWQIMETACDALDSLSVEMKKRFTQE
jgi:hypothetical protein